MPLQGGEKEGEEEREEEECSSSSLILLEVCIYLNSFMELFTENLIMIKLIIFIDITTYAGTALPQTIPDSMSINTYIYNIHMWR